MPEGSSIVILIELVQLFTSKQVLEVSGNTKIDKERFLNKPVIEFKSWRRHFFILFKEFTILIHFLLFGTHRINKSNESQIRMGLDFFNGGLNLYACGLQVIDWNINIIGQSIL